MLQTISWKEYFITIGLGTVLYYGWWLFRYYSGWQGRGRKTVGVGESKGVAAAGMAGPEAKAGAERTTGVLTEGGQTAAVEGATGVPGEPASGELCVVQPELPFPAVVEQPVFLPVVAGNLRNDILRLMDKVRPAEAAESELLNLLRGLLAADPYPKLKGTGFQEEINALIVREMERYGSILVDPEVVSGLWGT